LTLPRRPSLVYPAYMSSKKEQIPHEGLFLKIFKNPENTSYFLKKHLSEDIQRYLDLDCLYLENTSYVDEGLRQHFSDLVFSVMIKGEEFPSARVYLLFEHKSAPETLIGMQILRYMAMQWRDLYEQARIPGKRLPPILPIVIYQGQENWKPRTSFQDLVEAPSDSFKPYIPDFVFAFFDVRGIDRDKVQDNVLLKFYTEIIKLQNDPKVKEVPSSLVQGLLESMEQRTAQEYIEIFFKYLVKSTGHLGQEDYEKALQLLPEGGERIMNTLAEEWKQEAREEMYKEMDKWIDQGEIRATQKHIIATLTERFDVVGSTLSEKIKSITSLDTLDALFRKSHRVNSMDEFRDLVDKAIES